MVSKTDICSWINPCSSDFKACEDFKVLSCEQKTGIVLITTLVACTIIGLIAVIPLFRYLVDRCTVKPILNSTDDKAKTTFQKTTSAVDQTKTQVVISNTYASPEAWFQDPEGRTQFTGGLHSACTPLAVLFAASASTVYKQGLLGSPREIGDILDVFLKDDIEAAGFKNGVNYSAQQSVAIVTKLTKREIRIEEEWTVPADGIDKSFGIDSEGVVIDLYKSWPEVISGLAEGQGAVINMGGYALAVRRIQKGFFEFFDAHNGQDLKADKPGAYIKRCHSVESACAFLKHVINSGPAGAGLADTGEGLFANSVEFSIISCKG